MTKYIFRINNVSAEDHVLDLRDDSAALDESLKTAAGIVRELPLLAVGTETQILEVTEDSGEHVLRIEIRAARSR